MSKKSLVKTYYALTKPGIIYGNTLSAAGGFLLAARGSIDVILLLTTLAGIGLVIAAGCVFNNYIDRGIDKKMARTKKRALVQGDISASAALTYAAVLMTTGFALLAVFTNWLTVLLGTIAIFNYVVLYGLSKRHSVWGTIVGSISGALPIAGGYTAVTGHFDAGAWLLFLIMVCWQMPHFYAIAMYRLGDYKAASIPVLPVRKGIQVTKMNIILYVLAFMAASLSLSIAGYTDYVYTAVMGTLGLLWLWKGVQGLRASDDAAWARRMFSFSLKVLLAFSLLISLEAWLP